MDIVGSKVRSRMMASVRQQNTAPELAVRRELSAMGLRYRLHDKSLPGSPDIVLSKFKSVVFVHGCFWHRHGCYRTTSPRTRAAFWEEKFRANLSRDRRAARHLRRLGWRVIVIWECAAHNVAGLRRRLRHLFGEGASLRQRG